MREVKSDLLKHLLTQDSGGVRAMQQPSADAGQKLAKWKRHVADRVKELRTAAKLTQEFLARKADLPQSHVSRIEQAHLATSSKTIDKLAAALGVEPGKIDPSRQDAGAGIIIPAAMHGPACARDDRPHRKRQVDGARRTSSKIDQALLKSGYVVLV